ncbi:HERC1 [Symbiodinium sp. CCMP2592]|nr:HERC1 [Symbiodinium sp. CCMP2592]
MPAAGEDSGSLARLLEDTSELRRRILEKPEQVLTRWLNDQAVGVASVGAMKLNHLALEILARWWVERCPYPKTVPIDRMRDEDRCLDTFYEILKIAWVIPEGGLSEEALLAIEDGPVEIPEENDPPVEPAAEPVPLPAEPVPLPAEPVPLPAEPVPLPDLPSDPYMEKAASFLKLRSPRLQEDQDSQMLRASSDECITASPASVLSPTEPPPITPKKLFQEEEKLVLTSDDISIARARIREQLRPKLHQ